MVKVLCRLTIRQRRKGRPSTSPLFPCYSKESILRPAYKHLIVALCSPKTAKKSYPIRPERHCLISTSPIPLIESQGSVSVSSAVFLETRNMIGQLNFGVSCDISMIILLLSTICYGPDCPWSSGCHASLEHLHLSETYLKDNPNDYATWSKKCHAAVR